VGRHSILKDVPTVLSISVHSGHQIDAFLPIDHALECHTNPQLLNVWVWLPRSTNTDNAVSSSLEHTSERVVVGGLEIHFGAAAHRVDIFNSGSSIFFEWHLVTFSDI
jgi:hypothetical protein